MEETFDNNLVSFGRVVYVEPNNNINGTGKGTNFTFEPEDYSILVDLQVDVVDRFAYNSGGGTHQLQYTLEWDAKGTKTSMFKGTNGMLSTRALDTTFHDIKENYNQEAIGINSIEIRYNSWNYPEVTIQFTDIRGASLIASSDYVHDYIQEDASKEKYADNFANSFFSTFFRFPYPRYTLIVKGFYGRPVSYSLCVNDFKTKFNSQTGNFDVTVSFIGYMYGLFTDIPMRLLFVAPYCEYKGKEYWSQKTSSGQFVYDNGTPMMTLFSFYESIKFLTGKLEKVPEVAAAIDENRNMGNRKTALDEIRDAYASFINQFNTAEDKKRAVIGFPESSSTENSKYLILLSQASVTGECPESKVEDKGHHKNDDGIYVVKARTAGFGGGSEKKCEVCDGKGYVMKEKEELYNIPMEPDLAARQRLNDSINVYNSSVTDADKKVSFITGAEKSGNLNGVIVYDEKGNVNVPEYSKSLFNNAGVDESDYEEIKKILETKGKSAAENIGISSGTGVAVCIIRTEEFNNDLNRLKSTIDSDINQANISVQNVQEKAYESLIGFRITLKNVINMVLAHLDTFMACVYSCMDAIREKHRDFSKVGIGVNESDVFGNVDTVHAKSPLYLPPFFAFLKKNPETDEYEDEWLGNDIRFGDTELFQEIKLINELLNASLKGQSEARQQALETISANSIENFGVDIINAPTFANDSKSGNPYEKVEPKIEDVVATFAYRCMLASVYCMDYPTISNRFDNDDGHKRSYFEQFGENDAKCFSATEAFKTIKENYAAKNESGGGTIFDNIKWENFEKYITGETDGYIKNDENGQLYFVGNIKTPPFQKEGDSFIISCGDCTDKSNEKVAVPMNHKSPVEATDTVNSIISSDGNGTPNVNGFGISRDVAMPIVEIIKNDTEFKKSSSDYYQKYGNLCKHTEDLRDLGFFFKTDINWKEYFAGLSTSVWVKDKKYWFPSIALREDINSVDGETTAGLLYDNSTTSEGDIKYADAPVGELSKCAYDFFIDKKNGINGSSIKDSYIENTVVPALIQSPESVTVYGLTCGEGSLFESEFYVLQNKTVPSATVNKINENIKNTSYTSSDIINFRKAFLFLQSLPTSDYGSFGKGISTFMKRTYAPSMTDIPMSMVLFVGGLYFRNRANGKVAEDNDGSGNPDIFLEYGDYKKARSRQMIDTEDPKGAWDKFMKEQVRVDKWMTGRDPVIRPLCPLKKKENREYLTIISKSMQKKIEEFEKNQKKDGRLKTILSSNTLEYGYEPFYCGFWDVTESVKDKFIDCFVEWANGDFKDIDNKLSLKFRDGKLYDVKDIAEYREIIYRKIFDASGKAIKKYEGGTFKIESGTEYNKFVTDYFSVDMFNYHTKLGACKNENSLLTMFRLNTDPVNKITKLLTSGYVISAVFPRVLMTRDMFNPAKWKEERSLLKIGEPVLKSGWEKFINTINGYIKGEITDSNNGSSAGGGGSATPVSPSITPGVKLSLYETIKALHDKWLVSTKQEKYAFSYGGNNNTNLKSGYHSISDNFFYINSFYEDVGDEIMLNVEELPNQFEKILHSQSDSCSVYSFMYDIANQARTQMLALPVFNNMSDPQYVREMFTPMPYDKVDFENINTETQYIFLYPEEASKHLNLSNDSRYDNERYKYKDDSFIFVEESGQPASDEKIPKTFYNSNEKNVPVIGVTFAKQNQSFFKNISVSMDNPKTTEVSINNTITIAEKYNNGNVQATALGQDLFPIYSNYSYECGVEMMGCPCIMPLMYFQLNNIPMFKGTYIIYNVTHNITPGNMTTSFIGQRLSRFRKKRNKDSISANPQAFAKQLLAMSSGPYGSYGDGSCYTQGTGYRLEHDSEYNKMAKDTGIEKNILRAVEYAEVRYNGGFFAPEKLRVYYDPWQAWVYAFKRELGTPSALTVTNQFDETRTLDNDYDKNVANINNLIDAMQHGYSYRGTPRANADIASACTISGAFGIPGQAAVLCGAKDIEEFLATSAKGFQSQMDYFTGLLNNNLPKCKQMRDALASKNWETFAKLYKGEGGITDSGVFMPGDKENFPNYVALLKEGYRQACEASSSASNDSAYYYSQGQDLNLTGPGVNPHAEESIAYANAHPLDIRKAIATLQRNATIVYVVGKCDKINTTAKDSHGNPYGNETYGLLANTKEHKTQPGTKPAGLSISLCATYVKCALAAGGYPYFSCNGGFCGQLLERKGFREIYRSKPGDPSKGNECDSKWQTGDVMTVESFGSHEYGHIMMWDGKNWISDFKQNTCRTFSDWETGWNAGKYHVWRYRNIINK